MTDFVWIGSMENSVPFTREHSHDTWEIVYYTEGKGINRVGDRDIPFEKGTIICQPPHIPHTEISEKGYKNIFFVVKECDFFGMEIPFFQDSYRNEGLFLLEQLQICYLQKPNNWQNISESILSLLTEYMFSWSEKEKRNPYVEKCENILVENISSCDYSVIDTIDSLPLSNTYFMKLFKKETGYTPNEYITKKRIDYAKRLLLNNHFSDLRIKDISLMCGHKDQYYFSKLFKKKTGLSPEQMRKSKI